MNPDACELTVDVPVIPTWQRLLRGMLYAAFWIVSRILFRVRLKGISAENDIPGTICLIHHTSDFDGLIMLSSMYWNCRTGGPFARAVIVAGEHIFQPGFLSGYVVQRPRWLSVLLYPIRLEGIMKALGWNPIPMSRRRRMVSHLTDILEHHGNLPLREVFADAPGNHFPRAPRDARIRDILRWRFQRELFSLCDFSIFTPEICESLWQRQKERIASSLSLYAAALDQGGALFMAPHGMLMTSGRMEPIRSGLFQIVQGARRDAVLLPFNVTYDFMSTGRTTVFATAGACMRGVKTWPRERLEEELQRRLVSLTTVTLGHLASSALRTLALKGHVEVQEAQLRNELGSQAGRMAADGFLVDDRLVDPKSFDRRWRRFLSYGERKGLFRRQNGVLRFDPEYVLDSPPAGPNDVKSWVAFANQFEALVGLRTSNHAGVSPTGM